MTNRWEFDIEILIKEDLHSGTGTGTLFVDSIQARNAAGLPIIDRDHVHGVLRDNANRLVTLHKRAGIDGMTDEVVKSFFGTEGNRTEKRLVDCSTLTLKNNTEGKDETLTWTTTAREEGHRQPQDNSLRTIEYIAAGNILKGKIVLNSDDNKKKELLESILKFTSRLGKERTRGSGQLQWQLKAEKKSIAKIEPIEEGDGEKNILRLLFTNPEPLCLPKSGYPGNIIRTESFIPGKVLFAAIVGEAYRRIKDENVGKADSYLKDLFRDGVSVGNGYPLPKLGDREKIEMEKVISIPMPLHYQTEKPQQNATKPEKLLLPNWARGQGDSPLLSETKLYDLFDLTEEQDDIREKVKTKRPKGEQYIFRNSDGQWHKYTQPLMIRMRNRRGNPDTKILKEHTDLFSEQRIPDETLFVAEIRFSKGAEKSKWLSEIAHWKAERTITVGRGAEPLVLLKAEFARCEVEHRSETDQLTLTLTSDWIIRGDNLGYLQELDEKTLFQLFGCAELTLEEEATNIAPFVFQQDFEEHGAFNFGSGLPKRPYNVIKRGSSYRFKGKRDTINQLRTCIAKRDCWGERTREGYGRYTLDIGVLAMTSKEDIQ